MAEYYLISQLPSLDGIGESTPLPITEERFLETCRDHLSKKVLTELENLTLVPPREGVECTSSLLNAWYEGEKNLRLALAKFRADKMSKSFDLQNNLIPVDIIKVASEAVEIENPKDAENFLLNYRLRFLESLRPIDSFSEDYILYYALKIKLIARMRKFDTQSGQVEYSKIYKSILNGEIVDDDRK